MNQINREISQLFHDQFEDLATDRTLDWDKLTRTAELQGVAPLLYNHLKARLSQNGESEPGVGRLRQIAYAWEGVALAREPALTEILGQAADRDIPLLVMKGAALAYQIYPSPGQRPSMDSDLLVAPDKCEELADMLRFLGYELPNDIRPKNLSYQYIATRTLPGGLQFMLDIHHRINNNELFSRLFTFSELWQRAVKIPELGPSARGLGHSDAIILASMHRVGHLCEGQPEKLIWLYDFKLLIESLSEVNETKTINLLEQKELGPICSAGIEAANEYFSIRVPPRLKECLRTSPAGSTTAKLLGAGPLKLLWLRFLAQENTSERIRFLVGLALPAAEHIRSQYPNSNLWLPLLYLRRGISGIAARLK